MASFRNKLAEHSEALKMMDRAKSLGADGPDFRFSRAMQLVFNGRMKEAEAELDTCLRMPNAPARATLELARLRKQTPERNHLDDLARRIKTVPQDSEACAAIEFARYKELEDLGRYDEAWDALAHANAIMYARHSHDPAASRRLFERLTEVATPEFLKPAECPARARSRSSSSACRARARRSSIAWSAIIRTSRSPASSTTSRCRCAGPRITRRRSTRPCSIASTRSTTPSLGRRYLDQTQWRAHGKR